jgi:hypothetical protein
MSDRVKGTVAKDFLALFFFHGCTVFGPQILRLKGVSKFLFFLIYTKLFKYFYESVL